ncbi:hypothetical protein Taro_053362, partial [Colocasia esculenta]|nr:hypothetical protein [Colocasia esculenta]
PTDSSVFLAHLRSETWAGPLEFKARGADLTIQNFILSCSPNFSRSSPHHPTCAIADRPLRLGASSAMSSTSQEKLLTSVVSDIKAYSGDDPLRLWVRGIRRLRQCLPPKALAEKLPRFLQKCVEAFESDRRYRDDIRYLQVWILLMDHVDDPRGVLRRMEENRIGIKHATFYVAYALYYEKNKKFEKAEKMYHLGVRNLAEPAAELQKSYEQFLHRLKLHKKRISKFKEARENATSKGLSNHQRDLNIHKDDNSAGIRKAEVQILNGIQMMKMKGHQTSPLEGECQKKSGHMNMMGPQLNSAKENCENTKKFTTASRGKSILKNGIPSVHDEGEVTINAGLIGSSCVSTSTLGMTTAKTSFEHQRGADGDLVKHNSFSNDDIVVVKFVDSAIVGKSQAEDACHHGLVDPTINMKEAINAINSMFREPLEPDPKLRRKSQQIRTKANTPINNGFEVFIDENLDEGVNFIKERIGSTHHNVVETTLPTRQTETEKSKPFAGTFRILADDEDDSDCAVQTAPPTKHTESENTKPFVGAFKIFADDEDDSEYEYMDEMETKEFAERSRVPACGVNTPVVLEPKTLPSDVHDGSSILGLEYAKIKEDTVICNFVGSTVSGEREVEDACHHGLVDPTINLKEALHDINSMFGKPIDFVKTTRLKKKGQLPEQRQVAQDFSILVDEDVELPAEPPLPSHSDHCFRDFDLFEPTIFTKEAMDDINKMFGEPLDF